MNLIMYNIFYLCMGSILIRNKVPSNDTITLIIFFIPCFCQLIYTIYEIIKSKRNT